MCSRIWFAGEASQGNGEVVDVDGRSGICAVVMALHTRGRWPPHLLLVSDAHHGEAAQVLRGLDDWPVGEQCVPRDASTLNVTVGQTAGE